MPKCSNYQRDYPQHKIVEQGPVIRNETYETLKPKGSVGLDTTMKVIHVYSILLSVIRAASNLSRQTTSNIQVPRQLLDQKMQLSSAEQAIT